MDLNLHGCDLCGSSHRTHECICFEPSKLIEDRVVPSRALLTLPSQLCSIGRENNDGVLALHPLTRGTLFGPYKAPKKIQLDTMSRLPFKIFFSEERKPDVFLDTDDETLCNWMCLVRSSDSFDKSNLMAFQGNCEIFFRAHEDIGIGEELVVAYSPYYAEKMAIALKDFERCDKSIPVTEDVANDKVTISIQERQPYLLKSSSADGLQSAKSRNDSIRCSQRKREIPSKFSDFQTFVPKRSVPDLPLCDSLEETEGSPTRILWKCSKCALTFKDKSALACHLQKHFLSSRLVFRYGEKAIVNTESISNKNNIGILGKSEKNVNNKASIKPKKLNLNVINIKPCEVRATRLSEDYIRSIESPSGSTNKLRDNIGVGYQKPSIELPKSQDTSLVEEKTKNIIVVNKSINDKNNVIIKELIFSSKEDNLRDAKKAKTSSEVDQNSHNEVHNDVMYCSDSDYDAQSLKSEELYSDSSIGENAENLETSPDRELSEASQELKNTEKTVLQEHSENNKHPRKLLKRDHKSGTSETHIYECGICKSRFTTAFYLYRHTRKHTGDFSCVNCKKAFSRKEGLFNHNCKKDKTRSCCVCGKTFFGDSRLEIHMRTHSRPFNCQDCGKCFSSKHFMLIHACPQSTDYIPCPVCKKIYPNQHLMLKHIPVHTGQFSCPLCLRWLSTSLSAHKHIIYCLNIREISEMGCKTCGSCGKEFFNIAEYRLHEASHYRAFHCKDCDARFSTNFSFHEHRCRDIRVPCPYCQETFEGIPSLQKHKCRKFRKPHQCDLCKAWFGSLIEVNDHNCPLKGITLQTKSNSDLEPSAKEPLQPRDKFYICEHCGNTFSSHATLKAHKVVHGEKLFSCDLCGKRFHRKDQLKDHGHKHQEPNFPCPECGKLFKSKKILIAHSRIHTPHKRFSCAICSKEFHQKCNLIKHQHTHIEDRSYECEVCGKFYRCPETFKKHQLIHIHGKPLACSFCEKHFAKAFQLKHHLRDQHSGQKYQCRYCGIATKMRHSIIRHLKKKHSSLASEWNKSNVISSMHSINNSGGNLRKPRSKHQRTSPVSAEIFEDEDSDDLELSSMDNDSTAEQGSSVTLQGGKNLGGKKYSEIETHSQDAQSMQKEDSNLSLKMDVPLVNQDNQEIEQVEPEYGEQVEVDQTEYHFLQGDEQSQMNSETLQHQVVISDNILLNDQQIEELSQKLEEEHTGTFVLKDGTIIQQQEQEGSADLLFYVIAASEMQEV